MTMIPTKRVRHSDRYRQAEAVYSKSVKRVVGHSLGGSVALDLQKKYPRLTLKTYGAPVWSS